MPAPDSLYQLLYLSTAARPFEESQLDALLDQARVFNAAHAITGLLLFRDGCFMQHLEGPHSAVLSLYDRIRADPRHTGVTTLHEGPARTREFSDWSMGYRDLRAPEVRQRPGFSDFLDTPLSAAELSGQVSLARSLLLSFKADPKS